MFQISLTNYYSIEFALCDHLNGLNPQILDDLEFYRVQELVDKLNEKIKTENERTKARNTELESNSTSYKMPKTPKLPSIKLPKMK